MRSLALTLYLLAAVSLGALNLGLPAAPGSPLEGLEACGWSAQGTLAVWVRLPSSSGFQDVYSVVDLLEDRELFSASLPVMEGVDPTAPQTYVALVQTRKIAFAGVQEAASSGDFYFEGNRYFTDLEITKSGYRLKLTNQLNQSKVVSIQDTGVPPASVRLWGVLFSPLEKRAALLILETGGSPPETRLRVFGSSLVMGFR